MSSINIADKDEKAGFSANFPLNTVFSGPVKPPRKTGKGIFAAKETEELNYFFRTAFKTSSSDMDL
ncbi:MAG: hypothetical protein CSA76_04350 [Spirochaetales bacterium]|nr:MAG: hypothetical protein CSA76_04350 [Spirochaetales bacterium]